MIDSVEYLGLLRGVTIFSGLSDEELVRLCKTCDILRLPEGDSVVREGMPATEIYIILDGEVEIVLNAEHEAISLAILGPGNCIGEASVIGVQSHSASAIVKKDARLLLLSRNTLLSILQDDKGMFSLLILNIARELARRLRHTDEILLHYTHRDPASA